MGRFGMLKYSVNRSGKVRILKSRQLAQPAVGLLGQIPQQVDNALGHQRLGQRSAPFSSSALLGKDSILSIQHM